MKTIFTTLLSLSLTSISANAACVIVETEHFENKGGWTVDSLFIDQMGSSFLLAHGMGKPVNDASTTVSIPKSGKYHIYAKTRNWTAPWSKEAAGKFKIIVDGKVTETKKSASLGGTIVGGVVAGSIGAVIGGTNMATATSAEHVSIIKVHVLLRNSSANSFDIVCYDGGGAIKTTSPLYKYAYANAQNAFDILRVAIDKVQMENTKSSKIEMSAPKSNIQELKELAVLKQQGLITDEEFAAMKAKVINKDVTNM